MAHKAGESRRRREADRANAEGGSGRGTSRRVACTKVFCREATCFEVAEVGGWCEKSTCIYGRRKGRSALAISRASIGGRVLWVVGAFAKASGWRGKIVCELHAREFCATYGLSFPKAGGGACVTAGGERVEVPGVRLA